MAGQSAAGEADDGTGDGSDGEGLRSAQAELAAARASGDSEAVAAVVAANIWELFNTDYSGLLAAAQALPAAALERFPMLRLLHPTTPVIARASRGFDASEFNGYLGRGGASGPAPAAGGGSASPRRTAELGASVEPVLIVGMQMIAARVSGDIATAHGYAKRVAELLPRSRLAATADGVSPLWFLHHQLGSTLLMTGDTAGALREFSAGR